MRSTVSWWRVSTAGIALAVLVATAALAGTITSSSRASSTYPAKKITIGSVVPTLENVFWQRYVTFQKLAAKQLGFDLVIIDGQNNGTKMLNGAQNLITRKVNGLIFVAYFGIGPAVLQAAERAHVPTIVADTLPASITPQSKGHSYFRAFIGPNDFDAGYKQAQALFAATKGGSDGKIHVFGLQGTLGTSVNEGRVTGLKAAVKKNPKVVLEGTQTANFLRTDALNVTTNFLQAHSKVNAIWAANDDMALGALQAIKRKGKTPGKDIMVSGMDLNNDAINAVKANEMVVTLGGHWLQGGFAAGMLYDDIKGKSIPKNVSIFKLNLLTITKKNVASFEKQFPGGQPAAFNFKTHSQVYNKKAPPAYYALPKIK